MPPYALFFLFQIQLSKSIEDASFSKGIQRYLKFEKGKSHTGKERRV